MWKPQPMPFLKTEKSPQPERRVINLVHNLVHTAIPLTIKVVGEAGASPLITVQTVNISPQGLSTVIPIIGGRVLGLVINILSHKTEAYVQWVRLNGIIKILQRLVCCEKRGLDRRRWSMSIGRSG